MSRDFITIVSGLPRSGTSMMMQMLAAGGITPLTDNLRPADEDNRRGYFEFERVKKMKSDVSWLPEASGKVVKIIYMLLYHLPSTYNYRVVFMVRNLDEVLASQREMLKRRGQQGATLSMAEMRDVFHKQLEDVQRWLSQQSNFQTLQIDYNAVVSDPLSQTERIDAFLDGGLDVAAMAEVVTPGLYRQRQDA
jgi:hypothetical protein